MILIISEDNDISTDYVIEWLKFENINPIRINTSEGRERLVSLELSNQSEMLEFDFNTNNIKVVWYRRGYLTFRNSFVFSNSNKYIQVSEYLNNEFNTLSDYLTMYLKSNYKVIGDPNTYNANKLISLNCAKSVGLEIPDTLITNNLKSVLEYFNSPLSEIITKPIQDVYNITLNGNIQGIGTETLLDIDKILPSEFNYSLFQKRIDKKYELRIFFIGSNFYGCSIFSKRTDGRNLLDGESIIKIVPYVIPKSLKEKLIEFSRKMKIETGSIDLIVSNENKFVFLEVNPVGQFDYVSKLCNFYLEKVIAKYLIEAK